MKSLKKKMYVSETYGPKMRGKPDVRWSDRMKKCMHERVVD